MSIRNKALQWYLTKYGKVDSPIYTSKYYEPEESWPKKAVWWLVIPIKAIDTKKSQNVNIICQAVPNKNDFHHLKVPTKWLNENLNKFHTLNGQISLYLSANPKRLFIEERGEGNLDFRVFLVTDTKS